MTWCQVGGLVAGIMIILRITVARPSCPRATASHGVRLPVIWNLHHLDKTRRFRTSQNIPVYTSIYRYD
jgi:hypothetical protein